MKKFCFLKFINEIYYNNNFCDYNKNRWEISSKKCKMMLMIMRNFQINYLNNLKLMVKLKAKAVFKKKLWSITKKQMQMI